MAAILAPPGACSRARLNLSSTCRPGSIPIPIRCRVFRPICSRACRIRMRRARLRRSPRAPMARRPRLTSCPRRARRSCCRWSPPWCGRAAPPFWRRPTANLPAPRRWPGTACRRCASSTTSATPASSLIANPNNPDGRLHRKDALLALADALRRRGGVLVVDEAFMDVGPPGASLAAECRARQHRRAALVRQILRARRDPARFRARRSGDGGTIVAPRSVRGRYRGRRSPSAPRRWPMPPGSSGRGAGWRKRPSDSTRSCPAPASRSSAARACSGWRERRRRRRCSIISAAPAS